MKKIYYLILLIGLIMSCNKDSDPAPEKEAVSKPIKLEVLIPENHGSAGVKFIGRILHLNDESIKEHGFLIQEASGFGNSSTIDLKIPAKSQTGNNFLMVNKLDKAGINYEVKYYVITDKNKYLSEAVKFPYVPITLTPIEERNVQQGEIITIKGDFSKIDSTYYITGHGENSSITDNFYLQISADKKSLNFRIIDRYGHGDEPYFTLSNNLSMPIYLGRVNIVSKIDPLSNYDFYLRDRITFSATGFKFDSKKPLSILVGNKAFSYKTNFQSDVEDLIRGQKGNSFKFGYYNGADTVYFPKPLTLIPPISSDYYFRETYAHPNVTLSVNAYELGRKMDFLASNITLGGKEASIYTTWNGSDRLTIGDVEEGSYPVKFVNNHFNYTSADKITVKKLQITSFSPSVIHDGEMLTITGNFMNGRSYRVYSNIGRSDSQPAASGKIQVLLDHSIASKIKIQKIGYYDETLDKETLVDVNYETEFSQLTYTHFSPSKGTLRTPIRLYGEGIGRAQIFFDGKWMPSYNGGKGWTEISLYGTILPGKYKIAVLYLNKWYTVDQFFEITY